ncbi:hypothetical protein [Candidatus Clavichlamydia salmonicola]|uniref:hypothetical protein n=1 Tax=Candidatus Clavichlamydia salmonicola TaxID=469812 RepID=UPI001890E053|nr:hypothetical protein [Candidatus Clavichlamydia salmonicola]
MSAVSSCPLSFFGKKTSSSNEAPLSSNLVAPSLEAAPSRQAAISWLVLNIIALVFLVMGIIFVGISSLPANLIMFSGAYFVLGSFLAFLTAGILVGSLIVVGRDAIQRNTPSIEEQSPEKNIISSPDKIQTTENQDSSALSHSSN